MVYLVFSMAVSMDYSVCSLANKKEEMHGDDDKDLSVDLKIDQKQRTFVPCRPLWEV